ncbi:MAG: DUF2207 domain-containing protein [Chitinophagaceae bacterium]
MNTLANNSISVKVILLIVFFFFPVTRGLFGQSFNVSGISSRFIHDSDYDSLIQSVARPVALRNEITASEVKTRYVNNRTYYTKTLQPLLQSRFTILDKTYQNIPAITGTATYNRIRLDYLNKTKEILQTILSGTPILSALFAKDYNDRILSFHSDITVLSNGKLVLSEFITIFNGEGQTGGEGSQSSLYVNNDIKRGIVRNIPTKYIDKNGFWSEVGFHIKEAFKNGKAESYSTKSTKDGISVRLGRKDFNLPQGNYEYRIDYEIDRQLMFHRDKDELYWNVNGNGWVFTADSVSCLVRFPKGAAIKEDACYTGVLGSINRNCASKILDDGSILFFTSKRLESYEGLTIGVSIQKGIVAAPGKASNIIAFAKANYMVAVLALLLVFLFCFYYFTWHRKGRDPVQGVIYPRFSPPAELSPADIGYILDQRYQPHLFTAAIVDFSVKKYLGIEVKQEGRSNNPSAYYFKRPADSTEIPDTRSTYGFNVDSLYGQTVTRGTYNSSLKSCNDALAQALKDRFLIRKGKPNSLYGAFILNKGYTRFGGFLLFCSVVGSIVFLAGHPSTVLFMIIALLLVALIVLQLVFVKIMGAYTQEGRDVADHILGFKMYLQQSEQQVFEKFSPNEKTLALFEKYLPYAIALKVGNEWSAKFSSIMQGAVDKGYQPGYYIAGYSIFSMHTMSNDISSGLSGSLSSASTPPSSSGSGSGGGGSSGGGGGGGGGGGW